jgi:hypothetical protein
LAKWSAKVVHLFLSTKLFRILIVKK